MSRVYTWEKIRDEQKERRVYHCNWVLTCSQARMESNRGVKRAGMRHLRQINVIKSYAMSSLLRQTFQRGATFFSPLFFLSFFPSSLLFLFFSASRMVSACNYQQAGREQRWRRHRPVWKLSHFARETQLKVLLAEWLAPRSFFSPRETRVLSGKIIRWINIPRTSAVAHAYCRSPPSCPPLVLFRRRSVTPADKQFCITFVYTAARSFCRLLRRGN